MSSMALGNSQLKLNEKILWLSFRKKYHLFEFR